MWRPLKDGVWVGPLQDGSTPMNVAGNYWLRVAQDQFYINLILCFFFVIDVIFMARLSKYAIYIFRFTAINSSLMNTGQFFIYL